MKGGSHMPSYYDEKTKNWYWKFYYTDYTGSKKQKLKRDFKLQREAKEWECAFLLNNQRKQLFLFLFSVSSTRKTKRSTTNWSMKRGFLSECINRYETMIYGIMPETWLFIASHSSCARQPEAHTKAAGVKRIRLHDIRYSHASLLIEIGFSALLVSELLGHENVSIHYTLRWNRNKGRFPLPSYLSHR